VEEVLTEEALTETNVFDPQPVIQLVRKCRARGRDGQFSNADNMAFVGVLSTQLLHRKLIAGRLDDTRTTNLRVDIDNTTMAKS
jgi:asparagine synthase (glutamine-hydrolysing)